MTPAEAARIILEHSRPLPADRRPLRQALDAVLAEDVVSPIDLPPWDNSAMDGYAVRSDDLARTETDLDVIETIPAGRFPQKPLGKAQATRIFTGAPLPQGADTVIRQEDTAPGANGKVRILNPRDAKKNIRRRGEDIRKGAVVLAAGTPLGPAQLGVLASIAHDAPLVHRTPRVAFMGSGDEIVDLDQKGEILAGTKIASSNSYTLDALIRRTGAEPLNLGVARDSKESLREHLRGAANADLLVTTAGVSVGEHDLVRDVLQELGGELKLWRIAMRPGAPVGFGLLHGVPWIGLPGNPVSTMVTFELFVRPAIRRLQGHTLPFRRTVTVTVQEPITLGPRLRHYLRAIVEEGNARLTGPQGSGILTSMARANALLIVPADLSTVPVGTSVQALILDDPRHVADPPY
ncbi:MAG TPA: gephyrin-like molybdotransferase Glp [Gemmatimonadales bacterium]|jgi:molybdopterin molybdotransferase|nr:gephyrin-like molybdotransferase Glp [Gemmatimonadales bacterium]